MNGQPELDHLINDSSSGRRRRVAIAGHTGDEATARAHLNDRDPKVRASALTALWRLGAAKNSEIEQALGDPSSLVRRRALDVGRHLGGDALPSLVPLLKDSEDTVCEVACWALGEQEPPNPKAAAALEEVAQNHTDRLCREAAIAALGALGEPRSLATILAATTDVATVRRRAVIALAPYDGPEVDEALERARNDRDWQVRQAAEDLLA